MGLASRIVALALALASWPALPAEDDPVDLSHSGTRGRLTQIVRPEYPPEALAKGLTGVVEIEGVVRFDGFVDKYVYRPDKPESAIFVDALKRVTRNWRFVTPVDNDCQPVSKLVTAQVSFEIDNGTGRIFVTHSATAPASPPPERPAHYKAKTFVKPWYPMDMLQRNITADVYAKLVVDASGNVIEVKSKAYTHRKLIFNDLSPFTESAESTIRKWKYPEVPSGARAPWSACYTIYYRITD